MTTTDGHRSVILVAKDLATSNKGAGDMKMSSEMFQELAAAIKAVGLLRPDATMKDRWNVLWHSNYDVNKLYNAGLDDVQIDTALRQIAKGSK